MGTTGHWVSYYDTDTTEKVREWLRREYTWDEWRVLDLAQGTKTKSTWWLAMEQVETGKVMAVQVTTSNKARSENTFYTKEVSEDMGPYSTDIPKRLFDRLTPLAPEDSEHAHEWRDRVRSGVVRG